MLMNRTKPNNDTIYCLSWGGISVFSMHIGFMQCCRVSEFSIRFCPVFYLLNENDRFVNEIFIDNFFLLFLDPGIRHTLITLPIQIVLQAHGNSRNQIAIRKWNLLTQVEFCYFLKPIPKRLGVNFPKSIIVSKKKTPQQTLRP